jgi:hypothetical protein
MSRMQNSTCFSANHVSSWRWFKSLCEENVQDGLSISNAKGTYSRASFDVP